MERYSDKYVIVKSIKACEDSKEFFEENGWSKPIPVAVVDTYDDAKNFIANKDNLLYHLALIEHGKWDIHPDTNENHRVYYICDETIPFEKKIWFVKFYYYATPYYK